MKNIEEIKILRKSKTPRKAIRGIKVYLNLYKFNLFVYFKQINAVPNDEGRRKQAGGTETCYIKN